MRYRDRARAARGRTDRSDPRSRRVQGWRSTFRCDGRIGGRREVFRPRGQPNVAATEWCHNQASLAQRKSFALVAHHPELGEHAGDPRIAAGMGGPAEPQIVKRDLGRRSARASVRVAGRNGLRFQDFLGWLASSPRCVSRRGLSLTYAGPVRCTLSRWGPNPVRSGRRSRARLPRPPADMGRPSAAGDRAWASRQGWDLRPRKSRRGRGKSGHGRPRRR
jgi:hypothetical protein